jgi:hypothetical protein
MNEETTDEKVGRYLQMVYNSKRRQLFKSEIYDEYEMDILPIPIDDFMIEEGLFREFGEVRFLIEKGLAIIQQGG